MTESQGSTVVSVAIVFGVLTVITVSMRLFARVFIVKYIGPDDGLMCCAALLSWAFMIVTIIAARHGLGSHIAEAVAIDNDNLTTYSQVVWFSSIFYNACLGFIKISVLALYMRLGDRTLHRLSIVMVGVVCCQAGGNVLACIFQCTPIRAAYDNNIAATDKKCININAFYLANAAVNIFTDLLTYTLPIKLVANLQLPKRQKFGLAVMLSLGLLSVASNVTACISSIIRITFIPQMLDSLDPTYVIAGAMYWSVIEINVGILAASIPSFKAIAIRYAPRLLGSSYNQQDKSGSLKTSGMGNGVGRSKSGLELRHMPASDRFGLSSVPQNMTDIKKGSAEARLSDNSSEEALCNPPRGHISVKTQIETRYDERF